MYINGKNKSIVQLIKLKMISDLKNKCTIELDNSEIFKGCTCVFVQ